MKTGFAKIDITPPLGSPLCGQLVALEATGVESPLYASAMCIDDGKRKLAFVSCDLLLIPNSLAKEIAAEKLVDEVIVAATHTHSGPATVEVFGGGASNQYLAKLKNGILDAIKNAIDNLEESIIKFNRDELKGLAFNRRFIMDDDTIETHPLKDDPRLVRPEGPDSDALSTIWAETPAGKILGGMVVFGCHATVMERDNTLISADFPGKAIACLEHKYNVPFLFMQSACGNICQVNTGDNSQSETGVKWTGKMGRTIADKVGGMLASGISLPPSGLNIITRTIHLPRRKVPAELADWAERHINVNADTPALSDYGSEVYNCLPPEKVSLEDLFKTSFWANFYANEIRTRQYDYQCQPEMPFTIKIIGIGNLAIVTLPCELFIEWQNKIIENSPFADTLVIELANGWNGYIPTLEAFKRSGGYETKEVTSTMLVPEAGDMIFATIVSIMEILKTTQGGLNNSMIGEDRLS